MTQAASRPRPSVWSGSLTLRSAFALSVSIAIGLALVALWPARPWKPPPRPSLRAPIVFDEFVNAPSPARSPTAGPQPQ